ncbi:MAG: hypothetical protein OMM_14389, partial [Candidatus Magnetoglobus multicellularis str. Araruama]
MTYNAPILWSEGMPLHPHHFQASDRNILNDNREQAKHLPYNWGLAAQIDYDYDLLQGYTPLFRIKHARLRLEDGTWINIPDNAAVNDTQISEETLQNREILVFLGIKQLDQDEPVVKEKETDNTEKSFIAKEMDFLGETPNTQSKKVRVKLWQTKISFSHPPTDEENKQYEWIVIGRILSDGIQMTFNKQYIPPILNVCASDVLMNQISNIVKYMQS